MFSALLPLIVSTTWCTADLLKLSQQHCSKAPVHHLWPDDAMEMCHNVVDLIATSQQYIRWHWVAIAPRGPQEWRRVTVSAQQVDINSMDKVLSRQRCTMPLLRDSLFTQLQRVLAEGHAKQALKMKAIHNMPQLTTKSAKRQYFSSHFSVVLCISFSVNPDLISLGWIIACYCC